MTCAKKHVVCHIYDRHGLVVATGSNRCANPQRVCPREPGEGYEKCKTICGQYGHAEEVALRNAAGHGAGGWAVVTHHRICDSCREQLEAAGIRWWRLDG